MAVELVATRAGVWKKGTESRSYLSGLLVDYVDDLE